MRRPAVPSRIRTICKLGVGDELLVDGVGDSTFPPLLLQPARTLGLPYLKKPLKRTAAGGVTTADRGRAEWEALRNIPRPGAFPQVQGFAVSTSDRVWTQALEPLSHLQSLEVIAQGAREEYWMKVFNGVDEMRDAVGTHLGHSDWYEIDQRRVGLFAEATGDHQWIHVDQERAAAGPFGGTIAHGFLTLALLPVLTWEVCRTEGLQMEINYGLNKVRFPAPVPVPSRVRAGAELVSLEEFGEGHMSTTRIVIEREGGDKPVCVAESLGYLVPA